MEIVSLIENPIFSGCGLTLGFLLIGFSIGLAGTKSGLVQGVFVLLIFHKGAMEYSFKFFHEIADAGPIAAILGVAICIFLFSQLAVFLFFASTLLNRSFDTVSVDDNRGLGFWTLELDRGPAGHPLRDWSQPGIFLAGVFLILLMLVSIAVVLNWSSAANYAMHGLRILSNPIPIGLAIIGICWRMFHISPPVEEALKRDDRFAYLKGK